MDAMKPPSPNNWRRIAFIAAIGLAAVAFRDLLPYEPLPGQRPPADRFEGWVFSPTGQSAPLIFALSLCFLYTRHRALTSALALPCGGKLGAALLAPGSALYAWAIYTQTPDLLLISMVLLCLGSAAALGGRLGFRAIFLPAVFLLLLVPVPAVLFNSLIYPLQLLNADASAIILNDWLGIPATSLGTIVVTEAQTFHVIENCAGFRTMSTMVMAAIVYADLFQRSRFETALLLLAAPLVGLIVNLARVLSLMLNPAGEIVAVHDFQGIVMIVVGVLMLAALDSLLSRRLPADATRLGRWSPRPAPGDIGKPAQTWRITVVLAVLSTLCALSFAIHPWQPSDTIWSAPYAIPTKIDGWRATPVKTDREAMGSVAPNHYIDRLYTKDRAQIRLFVATDRTTERHTSLLSPRSALVGSSFRIAEESEIALPGVGDPVSASVLEGNFEQILSYSWTMGLSTAWAEAIRGFLGIDRTDFVAPRQAVWVRVSTSIDPSPASRRLARRRLRDFAANLQPWLVEISAPRPSAIAPGSP